MRETIPRSAPCRAAAGPARSGWRRPSGGSASMGTAKRSRTRCHLDGPTTGSASSPAIARSRLAIPAGQSDIVAGMKIIFSRKGFDSASGGAPSPIYEGRPISIPIPYAVRSETTYGDLGLGAVVEWLTKGSLTRTSFCHQDPMFEGRRCAFGQVEASQGHLENNGVGVGDVLGGRIRRGRPSALGDSGGRNLVSQIFLGTGKTSFGSIIVTRRCRPTLGESYSG